MNKREGCIHIYLSYYNIIAIYSHEILDIHTCFRISSLQHTDKFTSISLKHHETTGLISEVRESV